MGNSTSAEHQSEPRQVRPPTNAGGATFSYPPTTVYLTPAGPQSGQMQQHMQPPQQHYPQPPPRAVPTQEYQQTATIRNQVNLKKHTLRLEPTADPNVLAIIFTFDASASCRISTFVRATEDPKTCRITAMSMVPPPTVHDKGLEIKFGGSEAPGPSHVIDLGSVAVTELLASSDSTFPLIVRLEALTDEGREEGRSLHALPVGCELPKWVQSQSTYGKLAKEEDGSWGVRVIKQKIWVKGTSYELQEIFGMEQNRGSAVEDGADDADGNECVICMSARRDTTALPCRHMCMCHGCASALKNQTNKCPICRNEIESLLHIRINKVEQGGAAGRDGKTEEHALGTNQM
ncbi:MAG: hypothetical protein WDW38_001829 [Sanguina aurantia]